MDREGEDFGHNAGWKVDSVDRRRFQDRAWDSGHDRRQTHALTDHGVEIPGLCRVGQIEVAIVIRRRSALTHAIEDIGLAEQMLHGPGERNRGRVVTREQEGRQRAGHIQIASVLVPLLHLAEDVREDGLGRDRLSTSNLSHVSE